MAIFDRSTLSEEDMKEVNGGYIYLRPDDGRWEVIDDKTGEVVMSCITYDGAKYECEIRGLSKYRLEKSEYNKLRTTGSPW